MNAFVNSKGAKLIIGFTDDGGVREGCSLCESNNIPFLLLTNKFRYDSHGNHWTPEGNKFVSDKIYEFLVQEKLLAH